MAESSASLTDPDDALLTINEQNTIVAANAAAEHLFGYHRGELSGAPVTALLPERLHEQVTVALRQQLCTGAATPGEPGWFRLNGRHRSGTEMPLEIAVVLRSRDSCAVRIRPLHPISERLREEERVLLEKRKARDTAGRMRAVADAASGMLAARSLEVLRNVVHDACRAVVPFDAFTFGLYDPSRAEIRYLATEDAGVYAGPSVQPVRGTPSERVIAERRSIVTLSSAQSEASGGVLIGTMQPSESIIRTPILTQDSVLGVLSVQSYTPGLYTPEDVLVLDTIAAITATALQNLQLTEQRERDQRALTVQRAYLEELVRAAPEGIVLLDNADRVIRINAEFTRMFGYTEEEAAGRPINELLAPDHLRDSSLELTERVAAGETVHAETVRRRKDGSLVHVSILGTPIHVSGSKVAVYGIYRDITARKEAETRLAERERYFRSLIENTSDIIAVLDAHARFTYVSPAVTRVLGHAPANLVDRPLTTLVEPADRPAVDAAIARTVENAGASVELEIAGRHIDGSRRLLALTGRNLLDDSAVRGIIINLRDLTEQRAREARFRRLERLASLGTLIGGVAHELNNPLAAIKGYAELLLLNDRIGERDTLETIAREAARAAAIVADLRLLGRETQDATVMGPVDLNDAIRRVLRLRRHAFETNRIESVTELDPELRHVWGDRGRLEQVVLHLVVNAEQALAAHDGFRRITVRTSAIGEAARLEVADTGPGIQPDDLERIFDPFWTTKPPGVGTGLGLSLVHSIITEHNGTLQVVSEAGEGASFIIELPPAPTDDRTAQLDDSARPAHADDGHGEQQAD